MLRVGTGGIDGIITADYPGGTLRLSTSRGTRSPPTRRLKEAMRPASESPQGLPRRAVLTGVGATLATGAVLLVPPAETPIPEQPLTLRERWIEVVTARSRMAHPSRRARTQLHALDDEVRAYLEDASRARGGRVFASLSFDSEDAGVFSRAATRLSTMATAWLTPGSAFGLDEGVHRTVLEGVEQLLDAGYHEGTESYENWWDWEIGTARPLANILCLFREELPERTFADAAAAIRHFIPDPTYSRLTNYPTTASNRVNAIRGALIAAVAEEDEERIRICAEALPQSWGTVTRLDGFYADGGFIQHLDVAYTGNYGTDMLRNLAPMLLMLNGTVHDVKHKDVLWDRIDASYLPVMVNGHVLDAVRGRAVARLSSNGSVVGRATAGAIAQLAQIAPASRSAPWKALLRKWSAHNPTVDLLEGADIPTAVALESTARLSYKDVEEPSSRFFPSMDRLVHRAGDWTLSLSMSSNRIAAYEGTESENASGVLTGNAMRYVFVGDDPAPFDDHFWSTLDYSRPPGTTNHRVAFTPVPTSGGVQNVPRNEWTGGFVHGDLAVSAMHQVPRNSEAPECRRATVASSTWILEMVSAIRTAYEAYTTVENRLLPDGSQAVLVVDEQEVNEPSAHEGAVWAHLSTTGGYLFTGDVRLDAEMRSRVGSTRRVERAVEEIPRSAQVSRRWATLDLRHSNEAAWWVLLPGADVAETRAAAAALEDRSFPARVIRNDGSAQVVSVGGSVLVAAVWTSTVLHLTQSIELHCDHPVLLLAERTRREVVLRLTDPTQDRDRTEIRLKGRWVLKLADGIDLDDLTTRVEDEVTLVAASTRNRGGASFVIRLAEG